MKKISSYDIFGNVAVVKFPRDFKKSDKKKFAEKLLKQKSVKTVLEKIGRVKGRLRKISTKYVAGEKTKEVLYKENNCVFRFNIDTTYFSPRLSNERKEISKLIKKDDEVLVMFAGVAPFSVVIAKNSPAKKVYSNEINREANKYAKLNLELNKVKDKVVLLPGDIKKVAEKLNKKGVPPSNHPNQLATPLEIKGYRKSRDPARPPQLNFQKIPKKFDVIVMPRPNLKNSFLEQAFALSKKGTRIFYYDFCRIEDREKIIEMIKDSAKKFKKTIKILKVKDAGEIAPYKVRVRVDFKLV